MLDVILSALFIILTVMWVASFIVCIKDLVTGEVDLFHTVIMLTIVLFIQIIAIIL